MLAAGAVYPTQAFRLGSVVAVQFHPEVDGPLLAGWWATSTLPPNYPIGEAGRGGPQRQRHPPARGGLPGRRLRGVGPG